MSDSELKDLKLAADGCGEIARGFKKLRAFLLSDTMASLLGTKSPEKPPDTSLPVAVEPEIGNFGSDSKVISSEEMEKWAVSRHAGWGPTHATQVAQFMIGSLWRGDNFKNYWRYVGGKPLNLEDKRNWATVSYKRVCLLYSEYKAHIDALKCYLLEQRTDQTDAWVKVHRVKRKRICNVLEIAAIPLTQFTRIMKDNHKDLPPLRGRVKVV